MEKSKTDKIPVGIHFMGRDLGELLELKAKCRRRLEFLDKNKDRISAYVYDKLRNEYRSYLDAVDGEVSVSLCDYEVKLVEIRLFSNQLKLLEKSYSEKLEEIQLRYALGEYTKEQSDRLCREHKERMQRFEESIRKYSGEEQKLKAFLERAGVEGLAGALWEAPEEIEREERKPVGVIGKEEEPAAVIKDELEPEETLEETFFAAEEKLEEERAEAEPVPELAAEIPDSAAAEPVTREERLPEPALESTVKESPVDDFLSGLDETQVSAPSEIPQAERSAAGIEEKAAAEIPVSEQKEESSAGSIDLEEIMSPKTGSEKEKGSAPILEDAGRAEAPDLVEDLGEFAGEAPPVEEKSPDELSGVEELIETSTPQEIGQPVEESAEEAGTAVEEPESLDLDAIMSAAGTVETAVKGREELAARKDKPGGLSDFEMQDSAPSGIEAGMDLAEEKAEDRGSELVFESLESSGDFQEAVEELPEDLEKPEEPLEQIEPLEPAETVKNDGRKDEEKIERVVSLDEKIELSLDLDRTGNEFQKVLTVDQTIDAIKKKTVKCPVCGTMNYAIRWYCENCEATLTAL
ncbi:MAG TPA: hypothetical protein VM123_02275 [archaeon]|nr:hypothetical protein [archaeon]